jgi:hypothetical protein
MKQNLEKQPAGIVAIFILIVLLLMCAALAREPKKPNKPNKPVQAPVYPVVDADSGSVLFWQDGLLINPILKHTNSHLTHAAILLNGYVIEAVPPRVRKVLLADYIKEMEAKSNEPAMQRRGFKWFIVRPVFPYYDEEIQAMTVYAETQLGRPYQLRGWWKGREVRGIFCSQLVGDVLERGGRIKSGSIHESPGSLAKKLEPTYEVQQ